MTVLYPLYWISPFYFFDICNEQNSVSGYVTGKFLLFSGIEGVGKKSCIGIIRFLKFKTVPGQQGDKYAIQL
jgi:hypothetical protein